MNFFHNQALMYLLRNINLFPQALFLKATLEKTVFYNLKKFSLVMKTMNFRFIKCLKTSLNSISQLFNLKAVNIM